MNNQSATPAPKKKEKEAGLGTGAKVALGAVAGGASAIGASAAINHFNDDVVVEGAEGVLDDAASTAASLTGTPVYAAAVEAEEEDIDENEQDGEIDPNDIRLEEEPRIDEDGSNRPDDFVFGDEVDELPLDEIDVEFDNSELFEDEEVALIDEDTTEEFYTYEDDDLGCDPVDDIIL